jgi:chromosome partitioning protein
MKLKPAKRQIRVAVASNAGGSGKTTAVIHLAYGLGVKGYTVTIVELDPNGSLCTLAGLEPASPENSLAAVFKKDFQGAYPFSPVWSDSLQTVNVLQGGKPLEESINELYVAPRKYAVLQDKLEDFPIESDFIFFDTPASLEPMGLVALAACTHILAPIKRSTKIRVHWQIF